MRIHCAPFKAKRRNQSEPCASVTAALAAWLLLSTAAPATAEESHGHYHFCEIESECRVGNRVEDKGFSDEPWKPYETENLFVWVADVCLGYFMTRGPEALNGGVVTTREETPDDPTIDVELGDHTKNLHDSARLTILNYPSNKFGVFNCLSASIPSLRFDPEEFRRWTADRLMADEGWEPSSFFALDIAQFRNEKIGAIIRVYSIGGAHSFTLEADYYGPPIIITEGKGPY